MDRPDRFFLEKLKFHLKFSSKTVVFERKFSMFKLEMTFLVLYPIKSINIWCFELKYFQSLSCTYFGCFEFSGLAGLVNFTIGCVPCQTRLNKIWGVVGPRRAAKISKFGAIRYLKYLHYQVLSSVKWWLHKGFIRKFLNVESIIRIKLVNGFKFIASFVKF